MFTLRMLWFYNSDHYLLHKHILITTSIARQPLLERSIVGGGWQLSTVDVCRLMVVGTGELVGREDDVELIEVVIRLAT